MKKQRFFTILFILTIAFVAYKQAPLLKQFKENKSITTPIAIISPSDIKNSNLRSVDSFSDSLSAWEAFKKIAFAKLDANAKMIIQLKVTIPQGSDNTKRDYLKKISDFERRNDNLRNNLQVIKDLANESLVIFKNNFNYENSALVNEMQVLVKKTDPPTRKKQ